MFKISVIIPTCNDEKYIENCLEHVINQTMPFEENIQMIIVDDNSKDKSFEIAKKYEEKYPNNIITRKLDKNSGSGGKPRNVGIDLATGKYLMFSDADDFFDLKAFENMYNAMESKNADFIISNWNYTNEDGTLWDRPVFDPNRFDEFKLDIADYKDSFWIMNSSMCNKIFNREFINKHNIRCLENVPGEDTYFSMNAFLNSENVYYVKDITYFYRQRNNQFKTFSTSYNCSKEFFKGMSYAYKKTFNIFVEHNKIQFYRFLYARNMTYLLYRCIDSNQLDDEDTLEVLEELRWFFKLSRTLKVPACQKSLSILIDMIIDCEFRDAINVCKIIGELRAFMEPDVRQKMSKPYEEMYNEILKTELDKDLVIKPEKV